MKRDSSEILYEKYYAASSPIVKITLNNGLVYEGSFIGFCRGDAGCGEAYILKWHLQPDADSEKACSEEFQLEKSFWIDHCIISIVEFIGTKDLIYFL